VNRKEVFEVVKSIENEQILKEEIIYQTPENTQP